MMAFTHRKFGTVATALADQWYERPFLDDPVEVKGDYSPTADGACPVLLTDGSMAFVKPRPDADRRLVVAREKISSDLAHLVGVPVAPVAVRRPNPAAGWDFFSAVSLVCLPSGRLWQEGGAAHLLTAADALETLRVFWTWIGDCDHNGHGGNLLYQVDTHGCAVVGIDHSYSLCHGNRDNPLAVAFSQGYGTATLANMDAVCRHAVTVIQNAEMRDVLEIIQRMGDLLTADEQTRIFDILETRRLNLPVLLGL